MANRYELLKTFCPIVFMPEKFVGEDNTGRKTNEEDEVKRRMAAKTKRMYMFRRHVGRVSDLELLLS